MKKISLIACLCLIYSMKSFGQFKEFPKNDEGEFEFSEVIETDLSADQMYKNAKEWVVKNFEDYKSAVELEDDTNNKLVIKGFIYVPLNNDNQFISKREELEYLLTIECKDKKYRYRFNNLQIRYISSASSPFSIPLKNHINYLSKTAKELDEEKAIDQSKLKKKEKNELIESIAKKEKDIKFGGEVLNYAYERILRNIDTLKKAIAINDDF